MSSSKAIWLTNEFICGISAETAPAAFAAEAAMSEHIGNSSGNSAPIAISTSNGSSSSSTGHSASATMAESMAESGPDFDALRAACETRLNGSGHLSGEFSSAQEKISAKEDYEGVNIYI